MSEYQVDNPSFEVGPVRIGPPKERLCEPPLVLPGSYAAFIGGSATLGRGVSAPFAQAVGQRLGIDILNLGTDGAGAGYFLGNPELMAAAAGSRVCIVEAMCPTMISNRMFSVCARHNAHLDDTSDLLRAIYPEIDFSAFTLTAGMLEATRLCDPARFRLVVNEMRNAWIGRMLALVEAIGAPTMLLWLSTGRTEDPSGARVCTLRHPAPKFVDQAMVQVLRPSVSAVVECVVPDRPCPVDRPAPSAASVNDAAAEALVPALKRLLRP